MERWRPSFAIDENHIVALAVPAAFEIVHVQEIADEVAFSLRVEDHIILVAGGVDRIVQGAVDLAADRRRGVLAVPLCVKASGVFGNAIQFLVIDMKPDGGDLLVAIVAQRDPRAIAERHREIRVEALSAPLFADAGVDRHHARLVIADAIPAHAEEIAERNLDRRRFRSVPIHPQRQIVHVMRRARRDREVDVPDAPRAVDIGQVDRFARFDGRPVAVTACRVETRSPRAGAVAQKHYVGKDRIGNRIACRRG